jgi:hypothetical protein
MKGKTNKSTLDDGKPERWQAGKVRGKNFGLMRTKERGSYGKKSQND